VTIEKQASCDDPFDSLMPVDEARKLMHQALRPLNQFDEIELGEATGRILADDVVSPINVPSFTNSAMDGYAINAGSIPSSGVGKLKVTGTAWAGKHFSGSVDAGEAVRIFTGGLMPEGTDTVVIQEHVSVEGESVIIDASVEPGRNVRNAGEDVEQNQCVLEKGTQIGPAEIGLLASLGINRVSVFRKLRVAYFTTGDELCSVEKNAGKALEPGMLFDSNRYTLKAMLKPLPVEITDMGIIGDNEEDTRRAMDNAATSADLVITSGGVSAGDADFVTRVFHELGNVSFWKLAMRPGRPLAFGQIGDATFFGLPGNPVAVMVTFLQFVQPAIRRLMGCRDTDSYTIKAVCESSLRKSVGRVEYQRGILSNNADGQLIVRSTGKQGAGRISSMSNANCLIVIDAPLSGVEPGDTVKVQPFNGLLP